MKCEQCQEEGKTSKVYDRGTSRTMLSTTPYYDEDGVWHVHDSNIRTTTYECSNGHTWNRRWIPNCPAPGCEV